MEWMTVNCDFSAFVFFGWTWKWKILVANTWVIECIYSSYYEEHHLELMFLRAIIHLNVYSKHDFVVSIIGM